MNRQFSKAFHGLLILILASIACNIPSGSPSKTDGQAQVATSAPVVAVVDTPAPTLTPAPIVHLVSPISGTFHESTAHDNEESATFDFKNVRFGDVFEANRFERPFTVEDMSYLPYIDIFDFVMTSDADWYYVDVSMIGPDPATGGVHGTYGIEFDLDVDGRAEILLLATDPGSQWSTDRVQVFLDGNGDVGGAQSSPDAGYTGDGFETVVFDSGIGDDPDLAWAQSVIKKRATVKFAFKKSLLRSYSKFMWSVLASKDPVDPGKFYYNDFYSEAAAGSPNKESEFYPIKDIAAFDNSCRVPTGFQATGFEPLGCKVSAQIAQDDPSHPGTILIWIPTDIDWYLIFDCNPVIIK
jgi:hypothetical protein